MKDRFTRRSKVGRSRIRPKLRREIFQRDGNRCQYCQRVLAADEFTIDHLIPLALGGVDEPVNYVTACVTCNGAKAARPLHEFAASIRIEIVDLPVHGDPVIDNHALPVQLRLVRKRVFDSVRAGRLAASGTGFQKRVEKEYRRGFWDTPAGKALESTFPSLPGHARIMVPEIQAIAQNEREFALLVELAKSANTRNLIGSVLKAGVPVEAVIRRLALDAPEEALRKRLVSSLRRFDARVHDAPQSQSDARTP